MPEGKGPRPGLPPGHQSRPQFLIAYSGGLDSSVLLHVALGFFGPRALLAVHVNHGLQAAASRFEAHARRACREAGVALRVVRLKGKPAKGESTEAWARQARYQALHDIALRERIPHVLTAHHLDDQAESLLIALSRGAGLEGLSGIAPSRLLRQAAMPDRGKQGALNREAPEPVLHRPLLGCSRAEIEAHAREWGLSWIEDPSNADAGFLRNRIRREVMPAIRRAMPGFERQAARSQGLVAEAAEVMRQRPVATFELNAPALTAAAAQTLSKTALAHQSAPEQARTLRRWLARQGLRAPSQARLLDIAVQLLSDRASSIDLDFGGARIRRERDLCWIDTDAVSRYAGCSPARGRAKESLTSPAKAGQDIAAPELTGSKGRLARTAAGWTWFLPEFRGVLVIRPRLASASPSGEEGLGKSAWPEPGHLRIAPVRSSQKMRVDARRPRRSIKNLFQEAGIPASLRWHLPGVSEGDQVLYVPGLGTSPDSPWTFHFLPDL